jgi:predicted DNA binding CopG/RHH family protein
MKNKIKYNSEPIEAKVVSDFLPKPENLILKEKKTRVTLTLTQNSLDFFKITAKKHKASYQAMIRRLIDYYVANQIA